MSPEAAAVLSAIAAVCAVIATLVIGVFSIVLVRRANDAAKDANRIAKEALQKSQRALEISGKANEIAVDANDISTRSNAIAVEANEISQAGRDRETERNDVDWIGGWARPGVYEMKNDGQDPAHSVRATVTVDGVSETVERESVASGEVFELRFPTAAAAFVKEERDRAARARDISSGSPFGGVSMAAFYTSPVGRQRSFSRGANHLEDASR
jgi:hypothetical protein